MELFSAIHINRAFAMAILLTIVIHFASQNRPTSSVVSATEFSQDAKFNLNFQNRIRNITGTAGQVQLDCTKVIATKDEGVHSVRLDTVRIATNKDWGLIFRVASGFVRIDYNCGFKYLGLQGSFSAFQGVTPFIDDECGGQQCTWMFNNDGVSLFNLKDGQYHQKIGFRL